MGCDEMRQGVLGCVSSPCFKRDPSSPPLLLHHPRCADSRRPQTTTKRSKKTHPRNRNAARGQLVADGAYDPKTHAFAAAGAFKAGDLGAAAGGGYNGAAAGGYNGQQPSGAGGGGAAYAYGGGYRQGQAHA